jgi:hypothetical protein
MKYLVLLIFSMHFFFLSFADNGPAKKDNTKKDNTKYGPIKSNLPIKGNFIKPPVKVNVIKNGSFEVGNGDWTIIGGGQVSNKNYDAFTYQSTMTTVFDENGDFVRYDYSNGFYYDLFNGSIIPPNGDQFFLRNNSGELKQTVTIPNDAEDITWYERIYQEGAGTNSYDLQIIDGGTTYTVSNRSITEFHRDNAFISQTAPIPVGVKGKTVIISFTNNLNTFTSTFLLDNVSIMGTPSTSSISISNPTASLTSCLGSASSSPTTFIVTGSDLTASVTISAPLNFEIATTSNGSYTSSLTLSNASSVNKILHVRLNASASVGAKSGTITATSTGATGVTTTVSGTVNALPTVTVTKAETSGTTSNDAVICSGASITLSGGGALSYVWNNSITNGSSFAPSTTTAYTVTGTDANGCVNTAIQTVTVNALPTVTVTKAETSGTSSNDAIICSGASITLSGGGASSYVWNNSITDGSSFAPSTTTAYTVTGTDLNSCVNTAIETVTVNPLPNISISGTTTNPELVTLTASGGSTYVWSDGSSTNTANNTFDASGLYSLSVTDANGCISSTQRSITVQQWGLSSNGEKTLDSAVQINVNGKIASLNPLTSDGNKREYKRRLSVGDSYGGGIVAYIFQPADAGYVAGQQHGLIISSSFSGIGDVVWGTGAVSGTSQEIGYGSTNTDIIIAAIGSNSAAGLARSHRAGGYTDWYLPSFKDLQKIYFNINRIPSGSNLIGGPSKWSSHTSGSGTAGAVCYCASNLTEAVLAASYSGPTDSRSSLYRVVPVRNF